jgi:hypothetical protein
VRRYSVVVVVDDVVVVDSSVVVVGSVVVVVGSVVVVDSSVVVVVDSVVVVVGSVVVVDASVVVVVGSVVVVDSSVVVVVDSVVVVVDSSVVVVVDSVVVVVDSVVVVVDSVVVVVDSVVVVVDSVVVVVGSVVVVVAAMVVVVVSGDVVVVVAGACVLVVVVVVVVVVTGPAHVPSSEQASNLLYRPRIAPQALPFVQRNSFFTIFASGLPFRLREQQIDALGFPQIDAFSHLRMSLRHPRCGISAVRSASFSVRFTHFTYVPCFWPSRWQPQVSWIMSRACSMDTVSVHFALTHVASAAGAAARERRSAARIAGVDVVAFMAGPPVVGSRPTRCATSRQQSASPWALAYLYVGSPQYSLMLRERANL